MPSTRGSSLRTDTASVHVSGLYELRRALKKAEGNTGKRLRADLAGIGRFVRDRARAYAPVGPRPKRSYTKPLKGSIKSSVTVRDVTVYSNEDHSIVQDVGGQVGRGRRTILPRARVSRYMTRATKDARPEVTRRTKALLAALARDFDS